MISVWNIPFLTGCEAQPLEAFFASRPCGEMAGLSEPSSADGGLEVAQAANRMPSFFFIVVKKKKKNQ